MGIGKNFAMILIAGAVVATGAVAQSAEHRPSWADQLAQAEEKSIEGQVKSIDDSGTEITLADGTRLRTPPGAMLRPGALQEGMIVVATYREENGDKVLTGLGLKQTPKRY